MDETTTKPRGPFVVWPNQATWLTYRWLTDDPKRNLYWQQQAAKMLTPHSSPLVVIQAVHDFAIELRRSVGEAFQQDNPHTDFVDFLHESDWTVIARAFLQMQNPFAVELVGLFQLGQIELSPGVQNQISDNEQILALKRHLRSEWGDVSESACEKNNAAMDNHGQITSRFRSDSGVRYLVITAKGHKKTTLKLLDEQRSPNGPK